MIEDPADELRTFDDVARVCEAAGLERLDPERWHPYAWFSREHGVGAAVSCLGPRLHAVHVQRGVHPDDADGEVGEPVQLVEVLPRQPGAALQLSSALQIAATTARTVGGSS